MPKFKVVLKKTIEYSYVAEFEGDSADDVVTQADDLVENYDTLPWALDCVGIDVGKITEVTDGQGRT
jgi:hypothetical protein